MSASSRFNFEPGTIRNPSGEIKVTDRVHRKRQGRRMVVTGLMFAGLIAGLASQGDGGYFHDILDAESTVLLIVGILFLLFTVLTTVMGVLQLGTILTLTLNPELTEVTFDQTRFGRSVVNATVPVSELDDEVRTAHMRLKWLRYPHDLVCRAHERSCEVLLRSGELPFSKERGGQAV